MKIGFASAALASVLAVTNAGLTINNMRFYDELNRQTMLHGVNIVYKVPPYIPTRTGEITAEDSLTDEDISNLKKWGFNFIRLGVMWEAVERERGVYDDDYLS